MIDWILKTKHLQPIGLDIGHNSIKMIQLTNDGNRISIQAADKVQFDSTITDEMARREFIISSIKDMLDYGQFRGRNVVSCLPSDKLKTTSLRLSENEIGSFEDSLKKEISQRFDLDTDTDIIKYLDAGQVKQGDNIKNELIVFAADNTTIRDHIEMLEEAQLTPVAIDTIPCALLRSFGRLFNRQEDKERTVVFVDIGSQFTTVIFNRNDEISFVKQIPIGGRKINEKIASKLGIEPHEVELLRSKLRRSRSSNLRQDNSSHHSVELDSATRQRIADGVTVVAEELAKEISLCLRYYTVTFRGKRVENAIFAGGEAYENILLNVLKRQLTVEINLAEPMKGFDMRNVDLGDDRRSLLSEWAVAVGLSLRGLRKEKVKEETVMVQS